MPSIPPLRVGAGCRGLPQSNRGEKLQNADELARENEALRDRLSRLSEASLRINQSLDLDTVLQGVLDSARSLTPAPYRAGVSAERQTQVGQVFQLASQIGRYAPAQTVTGDVQPCQVGEFAQFRRYLPAQIVVDEVQPYQLG